jgi:hypothetical protein
LRNDEGGDAQPGEAVRRDRRDRDRRVRGTSRNSCGLRRHGDRIARTHRNVVYRSEPDSRAEPVAHRRPVADDRFLISTPAPTPRPTATPKPQPTLDWAEEPIGMSVTPDPAKLGAKVKVTVSLAAGPTCALKVRYPSGSNASLPKPTRPKPTSWIWTWTLPESAGGGTATATVTCTYGGVARGGPGTFTIVDPTPEWSISADVPATQPATAPPPSSSNILQATITVNGQVPVNPAYPQQRFHCTLHLVANGYTVNAADQVYLDSFDAPIPMGFSVGTIPTKSIGPASWTLTCENLYIEPQDTRQDSGTIEIT